MTAIRRKCLRQKTGIPIDRQKQARLPPDAVVEEDLRPVGVELADEGDAVSFCRDRRDPR